MLKSGVKAIIGELEATKMIEAVQYLLSVDLDLYNAMDETM
jgi:hypothetical protein